MEGMIDRDALTRYVHRVTHLNNERKLLSDEISAVYAEAKSAGFVPAVVRQIVRERKMDAEERLDHYALLDAYRRVLGMLAHTPLGIAALEAEAKELAETMRKPRPFVEQPVHRGCGRPKKAEPVTVTDLVGAA